MDIKRELVRTHVAIDTLRNFFVDIMKRWANNKDHVIGYVEWAPSIRVTVLPIHYNRDFCVIKFAKKKYKDFIGNVLSLGVYSHPSRLKRHLHLLMSHSRGHQHEEKLFLKFLFESTADMKNAAIRPRSKELESRLRKFIGLVQSFQAAKFEMRAMSC